MSLLGREDQQNAGRAREDFTISPEASRYNHVQLRQHHVGEDRVGSEQFDGCRLSLGGLSPIPGPEPPKHQVRAFSNT